MKDHCLFHCSCGPHSSWWGLVAFKAKGLWAEQGLWLRALELLAGSSGFEMANRQGFGTRQSNEANFEKLTLLSLDSEEINQQGLGSFHVSFMGLLDRRNCLSYFFFFKVCAKKKIIMNWFSVWFFFFKKVKTWFTQSIDSSQDRLQSGGWNLDCNHLHFLALQ